MGEQPLSTYTYEAYLALEAESNTKYEYHGGFIIAMAGGSIAHGQIASNFSGELHSIFKERKGDCSTFNSDVKISIDTAKRTYYPDVSVVCGPIEKSANDPNALINPTLILEVLSESTADFDRGIKFTYYRQLSSLREYVLISQDKPVVDTYYRIEENTWEIKTTIGLEESAHLKSIDAIIPMTDIYRLVDGIT